MKVIATGRPAQPISMQRTENLLGQRAVDAGHAGQFLDAGLLHALQPAEMAQQFTAALRAEAGDVSSTCERVAAFRVRTRCILVIVSAVASS